MSRPMLPCHETDEEMFYSKTESKNEYASYLFMCPIAVLIVTLGLFSSGLNT